MNHLTISAILCLIGGAYGLFVLTKHLQIFKKDVATAIRFVSPIAIGVLAWLSAAYTFYSMAIDSEVDASRVLMLVSWCWLASQYKDKYLPCRRKRKKASAQPVAQSRQRRTPIKKPKKDNS